jgi:hypothetical protein
MQFSGDADLDLRSLADDPTFGHRDAARRAIRFRAGGDVADLVAVKDDPHACGMVEVIFALAGSKRPWLNRVPMPGEVVCTLANYVGGRRARGEQVEIGETMLTAPEPPSAVTACRRVTGPVDFRIAAFPPPDIRTPIRRGRYAVWRYDGTVALPAVPAPTPGAVEAIHGVGGEAWPSPLAGWLKARPLGKVALGDLLGLLAHLPGPPDTPRWRHLATTTPTYWYRLMQPWVCLGILHQATDEPWPTSTRREVLVDLAFGAEDWVSDAALFALVTAAYWDTDLRSDVRQLVRARLDAAVAARRLVTIEESLAQLMLITPGCGADDRAVAGAALARAAAQETEQSVSPRSERSEPRRANNGDSAAPRKWRWWKGRG